MSKRSVFAWGWLAFIGAAVAAPVTARAHAAIEAQIEDIDRRLEKTPGDAALHLRRGELYRLHGEWAAALADCLRARELDPEMTIADLSIAGVMADLGFLVPARIALDGFLDRRPGHPGALVARARIRAMLGLPLEAAADFSSAIDGFPGPGLPRPEWYLERARALAEAGAEFLEEAVGGLDEGIERLGRPITLELLAIDLELERGRVDAALDRLARAAERAPRRETWLARRGEILERAGRPAAAREAFAAALAAIESSPSPRRGSRASVDLETRLKASLARLAGNGRRGSAVEETQSKRRVR